MVNNSAGANCKSACSQAHLSHHAQLDKMHRSQYRKEAHLQDWPAISGIWSCSAAPSAATTSRLLGSFCLQKQGRQAGEQDRQIQINRQVRWEQQAVFTAKHMPSSSINPSTPTPQLPNPSSKHPLRTGC